MRHQAGAEEESPQCFYRARCSNIVKRFKQQEAIEVNIRIIRVFTKLREYALTHKEILVQPAKLEKEVKNNSKDIENIFTVLKELIEKQAAQQPRNKTGFKQ